MFEKKEGQILHDETIENPMFKPEENDSAEEKKTEDASGMEGNK